MLIKVNSTRNKNVLVLAFERTGEMAQQVKALASKPDNLHAIPRKQKANSCKCPLNSIHVL